MWYIIFTILLVLSAGFLIWLFIQKMPNLANINVANLPEYKAKQKKQDILKVRLQRDLSKVFSFTKGLSFPAWGKMFDFFKDNYRRLKELEKDLRRRSQQQLTTSLDKSQAVDKLLTEAKQLANDENYQEAESILLDALQIDQYNVEVYKILADVYWEAKEYEQAKDTLQYLLKLTHNEDAGVFSSLASIAKERGDLRQAEDDYLKSISLSQENYVNFLDLAEVYLELEDKHKSLETAKRALILAPNNPKVLDFLIELSIIMRDKELAGDYLERLKDTNPDNQKIAVFAEQIENLK